MTIATMRSSLTQDDIRRLIRGDTPEARANVAHKICRRIETMELAPEEQESARQILDLMCNDAAVLVRRALAVTLRNSPKLPRDIAIKLAKDIGRSGDGGTFIPLALSRQELADMTGTTIETCIRIMSRWGKEEIVRTDKDGFTLLDADALKSVAAS